MEGTIDVNEVLDYAVFQISSSQNRYETFVCYQGKTEKLNGGLLDQLALHLPKAKEIQDQQTTDSFRLHVLEGHGDSAWFTKSTIARFLNIVSVPEALKNASAIENEMSQLEDTRNFQLTLYVKDHAEHSGGVGADDGSLKMTGVTHKLKSERSSSDATKNELLRAMDLRITVLKEELSSTFHKATGAACSAKQISDVVTFAQYFGAIGFRDSLLKYLDLCFKDHLTDLSIKQSPLDDTSNNSENVIDGISLRSSHINHSQPATNGISPAKIAQAERQSLTESEESSDSSNEEESYVERSRPMVRSATPRRSASPMRRVQIGRSGSRRSTALTIKSLNHFPAREKNLFNRDTDGNNSGDEETEEPLKRTDNAVRRMSVRDAVSLFESKQKDQTSDVPKRKPTLETSASTNKSVLRRWSAGMGDSFSPCSQENAADSGAHVTSNPVLGVEKKSTEDKVAPDLPEDGPNHNEFAESPSSSEAKKTASPPMIEPAELVISQSEETNDRATASAEWNRQKEAELNEMLMKMMENKPGKYRAASAGYQDVANEQRGGFYSQYKEKRDEKLRAENAGKQAAKVAQFKVMQETLEQSKAQMTSKSNTKGKQDSVNHSQRPRRNSSPPVLTKKDAPMLPRKEASKPAGTRKVSPKSSSLSSARNSSLGSSPKTVGTPPARSSPGTNSTGTPATRRKPQPSPSPTRPSPRTERQLQPKGKKGATVSDSKPSLKAKEDTQQKTPTRNSRSAKTKNPSASGDDSVATLTKPSFYSKVTKKSSVVPLESKPFLKKGTGIGPGVGPVIVKTKVNQSDESLKDSGSVTQTEEKDSTSLVAESTTEAVESCEQVQPEPTKSVEPKLEIPEEGDLNHEETEDSSQVLPAAENSFMHSVEPVSEIQSDLDMGISSAAWVEVEHQDISSSLDNCLPETAISPELVPMPSSSPRIRHSLSQMLQADTSEPEIVEWGNAENPPALVYQKDAPKGFKRLLKFARKSKGEANVTGWASPSVFSEGEDDSEESKAASKRNPDALSRKAALQAKGYGQQKALLSESFDSGNSSKRATDYRGMHSILSGHASMGSAGGTAEKLREGHSSASSTSTKATRSFFSLSTFRSGKSSEAKLR